MAKNEFCLECVNYNNGWCNSKKTNQGLKYLSGCEFRKTKEDNRLEQYLEQKRFELEIEDTDYNRGIVRGLEMAVLITNKEK